VKKRLHVDLAHSDPEAFIVLVESPGGSRPANHDSEGFGWTILADPESNEIYVAAEHWQRPPHGQRSGEFHRG
jgi:hypothetical protein